MNPLEIRIAQLEARLNYLEKSDRYAFQKSIQMTDGRNIQLGIGTGTKIGTGTTQKLGFYNKAPVAQQTGVAVTAAGIHAALVSLGLITA